MESRADKLEKLKFYRSEIALEWNFLLNRVGSYITSQSFLVTAFAISMGNTLAAWSNKDVLWPKIFAMVFPPLLCIVGILTTLRVYPSIDGAIKIITLWLEKQRTLLKDSDLTGFQVQREGIREGDYRIPRFKFSDSIHLFYNRNAGKTAQNERANDDIQERSLHFAIYAPEIFFWMWIVLLAVVVTLDIITIR